LLSNHKSKKSSFDQPILVPVFLLRARFLSEARAFKQVLRLIERSLYALMIYGIVDESIVKRQGLRGISRQTSWLGCVESFSVFQ